MKKLILFAAAFVAVSAFARSASIKLANSTTLTKSTDPIISEWWTSQKYKVAILSVGTPSPKEITNSVRIVAATVVKDARTKKTFVNDIQESAVDPNVSSNAFTVYIASGAFEKRQDRTDDRWTSGWMADGIIVEVWDGAKMMKRLATFSGPLAKKPIDKGSVMPLYLECDCLYDEGVPRKDQPDDFSNKTMLKIACKKTI